MDIDSGLAGGTRATLDDDRAYGAIVVPTPQGRTGVWVTIPDDPGLEGAAHGPCRSRTPMDFAPTVGDSCLVVRANGRDDWWIVQFDQVHGSQVSVKDPIYGAKGDGVVDDTVAFQAAAAALSPGGTLVIPPGVYMLGDWFSVPSNCTVRGVGNPTLKAKAASVANPLLLGVADKSDVTIEGVIFDGNRANVSTFNNVVTCAPATRVRFIRCRFTNTRGIAVVFGGTGGVQQSGLERCRFDDCGNQHEASGNSADRRQAISYSGGGSRNFVNFCDFEHIGLDCISFAGGESLCQAIGNTITNTAAGSIYVSTSTGFRVAHNYISNGAAGGNGIDTHNSTDGEITGNVCEGNGAAGILLAGCQRVTVTGNKCSNNWQSGTSGHRGGITFDSSEAGQTTGHITLATNVCVDTQGSPTQQYAIGIVTGSGTLDRDSIKVDASNLLRGYTGAGAAAAGNRFQTTDLGAVNAVQLVTLAANATFTVASTDKLLFVEIADLGVTHAARFFINQTATIRILYDTGTLWATTDTGTLNAIFNDGAGAIKIRNRTAGSKTYAITVADKVRMA